MAGLGRWRVASDLEQNRIGDLLSQRQQDDVVSVATRPQLTLSQPKVLFEGRYTYGQNLTTANYDVDATAQQFLMVKEEAGGRRVNLVFNWTEELTRRSSPDAR